MEKYIRIPQNCYLSFKSQSSLNSFAPLFLLSESKQESCCRCSCWFYGLPIYERVCVIALGVWTDSVFEE